MRCKVRNNKTQYDKSNYWISVVIAACDEEWRRITAAAAETQRLLSPGMPGLGTPMRSPATPLGAPLILSPRIPVPTTAASLLNGSGHQGPLLSPHDPHGLIYTPYADYANYAALAASPLLTEYATADHSGGLFARWHWLSLSSEPFTVEKTLALGLSFIRDVSLPLCLRRCNVSFTCCHSGGIRPLAIICVCSICPLYLLKESTCKYAMTLAFYSEVWSIGVCVFCFSVKFYIFVAIYRYWNI